MDTVDVFLSHNSRDKAFVCQVAEGLELEFGIPHFLDAYAIPTGEAFLPWIERTLSLSSGCAIFLGGNGWGETHFWEAERALDRYRQDPAFRLIPVALPGIRESDMKRLGAGNLFTQVNWADFRSGTIDSEVIGKLRAAIRGETVTATLGPVRLTPYLLRRDARRWMESRRKDTSILYRGRQLKSAQTLREDQPDLAAGEAIDDFLLASAQRQIRQVRTMAVVAVIVAVTLAMLVWWADSERRLANARFIASEARQAPSPDTGLLLALQATVIADAPEAHGALLERIDAQPYLRQLIQPSTSSVASVAFSGSGKSLFVAYDDGELWHIDVDSAQFASLGLGVESIVRVIEAGRSETQIWVGTHDGRVLAIDFMAEDSIREVVAARASTLKGQRWPILSLEVDITARWMAVGDHAHGFRLVDLHSDRQAWSRRTDAQRVTAVSFSATGERVAVGDNHGLVEVFKTVSGEHIQTFTTARAGEPKAMQFSHSGDLRVIDSGNVMTVFDPRGLDPVYRELGGVALSSAAVGPRRESGPILRRDVFVVGHASGDVSFTPVRGESTPVNIQGHGRTVYAAALSPYGRYAVTGDTDGKVAIWDLQRQSPLITARGVIPGHAVALRNIDDRHWLAVITDDDTASVVRWNGSDWRREVNLVDLMQAIGGTESIARERFPADEEGFIPVESPLIAAAAISNDGHTFALVTRHGALWTARTPWEVSDIQRVGPPHMTVEHVALSRSGHYLYAIDSDRNAWRFDIVDRGTTSISVRLPAGVRQLRGTEEEGIAIVALDDGTVQRLEFNRFPAQSVKIAEPGVVIGQLAIDDKAGSVFMAGAGSNSGVDVGRWRNGEYRRLHSRRVEGAVSTMAILDSAGIIAATDHGGLLHLWDLDTLVPMATLRLGIGASDLIETSADGMELAIANLDGDLVWLSLDHRHWRRAACAIVRRDLSIMEWQALMPGSTPRPTCNYPPAS